MKMNILIIYNFYSANGFFVGERTYRPRDRQDYIRVMEIIERNTDQYELVNVQEG